MSDTVVSAGAGTGSPHLWALMPTSAQLDLAIKELEEGGFDRADLSLPEIDPPPERATPEAGAEEPDTDVEAQQSRLMHGGVGGAIGAMIGATAAAAATGGAAVAVAGAAIGAGLAVGAAANAVSRYASNEEQQRRDKRAAEGKLVLEVRLADPQHRTRAEEILRAAGASRIW
jgi:hypothetical protein